MPAVRSLDDPTPRLPLHAADEWRFAATADVRDDSATLESALDIAVIVSLVQATVLGASLLARSVASRIVHGRDRAPLVVDVRPADPQAERYAPPIRDDVPLAAALGAVRRVGARKIPPFGALMIAVSKAVHCQAMPFLTS